MFLFMNGAEDVSAVVLSLDFTLRILYFSKIIVKAATAFPENNCLKEVSLSTQNILLNIFFSMDHKVIFFSTERESNTYHKLRQGKASYTMKQLHITNIPSLV